MSDVAILAIIFMIYILFNATVMSNLNKRIENLEKRLRIKNDEY